MKIKKEDGKMKIQMDRTDRVSIFEAAAIFQDLQVASARNEPGKLEKARKWAKAAGIPDEVSRVVSAEEGVPIMFIGNKEGDNED